MTRPRDSKGRFVGKDALASFTASMASELAGGWGGYRDGPFTGYAKDGNAMNSYYASSWLAKAAVERIPEDCFKKSYTWIADANQISAIEAIERRLKIKEKKKLALQNARRDGEGYIYFDTGQSADSPLEIERVGLGGLRFVNVLLSSEVTKQETEKDPVSEFYGQPKFYRVGTADIHPSRICRFVRNPDPQSGKGQSDLVHLLPPIVAAETARDNVVALTTEALIDIMKVEGLMDAVSDPSTEQQLVRRYQLFRHQKATNKMGVIDMTREDYERKPASFGTLPEVIEAMRREVAAALEIPYALLFGRNGGLGSNSDTDLAMYYDMIESTQKNDIQPACDVLDEVLIRSALGSRPEEIYLEWQPLWQSSDKERADIAAQIANTAKTLADGGIIPPDILTESTVNALTENGSFPGIETSYADWAAAGGWEAEEPETVEVPEDGDDLT